MRANRCCRLGEPTRPSPHSPQWLRNPWFLLVVVAGCALAAAQFRGFAFPARQATAGPRLQALRLHGLSGGAGKIALGDLQGRVTVLHLWGPWDAASRMQLSYIADLHQRFRSNADVLILPVCCAGHAGEDLAVLDYEARRLLHQANIQMPCYVDPDGTTRLAASRAVGLQALPLTLVLDRQGIIRQHCSQLGPGQEMQLRQLIVQLLEQ